MKEEMALESIQSFILFQIHSTNLIIITFKSTFIHRKQEDIGMYQSDK